MSKFPEDWESAQRYIIVGAALVVLMWGLLEIRDRWRLAAEHRADMEYMSPESQRERVRKLDEETERMMDHIRNLGKSRPK